ncbi:ATP-binding domain-containing protein, partial [Chamaesiphon sp. OTE_20_metabat_361]|uniref:ATP-binding domain-containing protein n=1 Tax=Chamaesiphon sp. OTE_20_metabat_361 TaxID=2964689 RepID=UPI00286D322B
EYPVVILPLYMQHYLLLSRNLVYTGLTRAKKLAIVVGSNKAILLREASPTGWLSDKTKLAKGTRAYQPD